MERVGLFLVGSIIGSFVASLTYRLPRGISIAKGRSFCPRCGRKITALENIPLLAYLFLKGRCRGCRKKISVRYPLIELSLAFSFLFLFEVRERLPFSGDSLTFFFFLTSSVLIFAVLVIDLEERVIPDSLVFALLLVNLLFALTANLNPFPLGFAGFFAAFLLLVIASATGLKGLGLGDVKLAIPLGFLLGFPESLLFLYLSFLIGGALVLPALLLRKAHFGDKVAFAPFMIFSFWVVFFWGEGLKVFLTNLLGYSNLLGYY